MPDRFESVLGQELGANADRYAAQALARITEDVPEIVENSELAELATIASRALFTEFGDLLQVGGDDARPHAPAAPLAFVRELARNGVPLATVLRSYRLGQEVAYERTAQLAEELEDPNDRVRALARVGILSFRFVDSVMTEIADEYMAERELFIRGSYARRRTLVRDMLAGRPFDCEDVERTLGHRLAGAHRAIVAWSEHEEPADEQTLAIAVGPLLQLLGSGRPLIVADGEHAITAWVTPAPAGAPLAGAVAEMGAAGVRAAAGEPGDGPAGFLATKRQADLARTVARLSPGRQLIWYGDVALAAVLLRDRDTAWAFAVEELGELAEPSPTAASLRASVSAYLQAGRDQSQAARAVSMHRNTLARHLRRAEALVGHPLNERTGELEAALVIAETLNGAPG